METREFRAYRPEEASGKELLEINVDGYVRHLMDVTGSSDVSSLMNKALTTLAWAVESKNDGKRVYATKENLAGRADTQELVVDE